MSTKTPSELEADETAQKRAQAEQFSFDIETPGHLNISNESQENLVDHRYVVFIAIFD
ncbi:hypothetical protein [Haladaptatus pallidirubidus]|uniref:Uncharacterized protein n=2 Tax=Haladaptatus pallidirubidus TaxID=1008152 RepID=A0AAV3UQ49_9EURY